MSPIFQILRRLVVRSSLAFALLVVAFPLTAGAQQTVWTNKNPINPGFSGYWTNQNTWTSSNVAPNGLDVTALFIASGNGTLATNIVDVSVTNGVMRWSAGGSASIMILSNGAGRIYLGRTAGATALIDNQIFTSGDNTKIFAPITLLSALTVSNVMPSRPVGLDLEGGISNGGFNILFAGDGNTTVGGAIVGAGGVYFSGSNGVGSLTLSANNTYTGGTTISNGVLKIGAGGASGSVVGDIVNAGTVVFNRTDSFISSNNISGSGTLVRSGTGVLTLTGTNTYSGATTNNGGGGLQLGADYALGTGNLVFGGGTLQSADATTRTISNNFTMVSNATLNATATGGLVINGAYGDLGTGVGGFRTFTVGSNMVTIANVLTNTAGLAKAGTGTLVLLGTNTYGGSTRIDGGALRAVDGVGFTNNLIFNSGTAVAVYEGIGTTTFSRALGAGANQVQFNGSGGFSASGGKMSVNLFGDGRTIVWGTTNGGGGTASFMTNGMTLFLGSLTADSEVDFQNGLDLNGGLRTVQVADNLGTNGDFARISGLVTNGGLTKAGGGTLVLDRAGITNFTFGSGNAGTLRLAGGQLSATSLNIGSGSSDTSALIVDGSAASVLLTNANANLSIQGNNSQLQVLNGGRLTVNMGSGNIQFGVSGTTNQVLVAGTNSTAIFSAGNSFIGQGASVQMVVSNTGQAYFNNLIQLGYAGGPSSLLVSDSGSVFSNSANIYIGSRTNSALMVVSNGGRVFDANGTLGYQNAGTARSNLVLVTGTGSLWANSGDIKVGDNGAYNTLVITNGGTVSAVNSTLGSAAGSISNLAMVAGAGSTWTNTGTLTVGSSGSYNTLVITNRGTVISSAGALGSSSGTSNNMVFLTGAGALWTNTSATALTVGAGASSFSNGIQVSDGAILYAGGFSVGAGNGVGNFLLVQNGGLVLSSNGMNVGNTGVGAGFASNASVLIRNAAISNLASDVNIGNIAYASSLVISNRGSLFVGGTLMISRGNYTGSGGAGAASGNSALLTDGSTLTAVSNLVVGGGTTSHNNSMIVSNGASLTALVGQVGTGLGGTNNSLVLTGPGTFAQFRRGIQSGSNGNITGSSSPNGNGYVLVLNGATLETVRMDGGLGGMGGITSLGGVFQFITNTPNINLGTAWSISASNSTVSFRGVTNAAINGQITNISYFGANTLRLDASTNAALAYYAVTTNGGTFNTLELLNNGSTWRGGMLDIRGDGLLRASNALATIASLVTNAGMISVINGQLTYLSNVVLSGGTFLTQNGTNQFNGGLSLGSAGALTFTNGSSYVSGAITNSGTINAVNANVTFGGPLVVSGLYASDPSTNNFTSNVTVTASGAMSGGVGDLFIFQKDFINQSTNRAQFNLSSSAVLFSNSATHLLSLSNSGSVNIGQGFTNFAQVATNFAIGQLSVASGERLTLAGNKDSVTNALYVGWLDIQGIDTNSYASVTNGLFAALNLPNINLYYNKFDVRNDWLTANLINDSAAGFNLWGGGLLLPIPEPSAALLAGTGLLLLGAVFRRRKA